MANLTCKFYARRSSDTYIYLIIKIGIVKINDSHAYISQCFAHELPCTTRYCPPRKRTVLPAAALVAILAMTLVVTGGGAIQHAGEPWQVAALNPETYQPAGTAWSILDTATSALLPGYAFAQVQDSTPPTFDSSELHSDTGVLTITFSETIDVTPATNVVPAKIHIRESDSYTGGITLSAGELDTAAATDGTTISFTLTESHLATVAGLTTPELTIEPGAVRDTSGNPIDGTFDISTAVFVDATSIRPWTSTPTGMTFSNDGLRMFVTDGNGYDIDEYALSDAFDASTLIHVNSTSVSTNYVTPTDMAFSNDGLKMFTVNVKASQERTIKEYTLSTAFDVSTLQFVRDKSVRMQEMTPTGMAFSSDGLKMFVVGFEKDSVNEYTLSAPFDLYRDVFVHAIPVADQESTPRDVAFSNDGLKMFVVGSNQDKVHEYTLSTAFDISTAIHVDFLSVADRESTPSGMAFSNDGAKMFVVGSGSNNVYEYTLNSVYPITVTTTSATTPTLASIVRYDPVAANTGSQTLVYKATFSEDVTGVDASDFALSSGSTGGTGGGSSPVTNISGLGDVYHVTVFALQNGTYNLDLVSSGHGIADAAANPLTNTTPTTGTDQTYTVSIIPPDNTVPTLVSIHRSSPAVGNTDSQTLVYKVTFSEDVTGVNTSDFALSPDSIGGAGSTNIGGNSEQFKQTRSPALAIPDKITVSDTITVSNSGTAASVYVAVDITHAYIGDLKIDLIAPDGATRTLHNREGGSAGDLDRTYTLSFDDLSITGTWKLQIHDGFNVYQGVLNNWTLTINYGDPPTIPVTGISGSGDVYSVTVSALQDGAYNLDLVSSGHNIADAASNFLANTSPAGADETYTVSTTVADNTNPRLESIERYNPASQNTDSSSLIYKATFNESVTGVDASDFVLSLVGGNAGTGSITGISGSGSVYYVTVSATQDGTYNLDLVSSGHGIRDTANNLLNNTTPTTGTDETYTVSTTVIDNTNPRLASIERYNPASQNTDSSSLIYKATFNESVTGVDASDFVLSLVGGNAGTGSITGISGSGSVYYMTVSVAQDGTYNLDLVSSGHGIRDTANNLLNNTTPTTGTDETYTVSTTVIDNTNPRLASIERYNPASQNTDSSSLIYKATFNESVTGVDASDFVLSLVGGNAGTGSITGISGSGSVYYVTVSAAQDGTYNLDLVSSGHGIEDIAENPLTNTVPTTGTDETYTVSTVPADSTAPTLESIERHTPATANTDSQTLIYKATFSEDVTGVTASDFALSSDSAGGENTTASTGQFTQTKFPNLGIPDLQTVSDTIEVSDSETATSVSVDVDITHDYIGDLKIDLIAPDGTSMTLHNNTGNDADDIDQMYTPNFGSIPIFGTWKLQIHDNYGADPGVLNSWTLTINYGDTATTLSSVTDVSGSGDAYYVTVSAAQDGTYNLDLVSSGHGIKDAANNSLTNVFPTGADETYTVSTTVADNTNPRLESIERHTPATANTDSQTLIYKATFSEDVTGVTASDFALSSDSAGGENTTASTGQFTQTKFPNLGIPDLQTVSDTIEVSDSETATSVSVDVDITHDYIGDLKIDLIAPDGTSMTLHNNTGNDADDIDQMYTPNFGSIPIFGTWKLQIHDNYGADPGVLNSWTLTINYGDTATTLSSVTDVSGSGDAYYVTVSAAQDGTYNLDLVSSGHGIKDAANNSLTNVFPTGADETYTVSTTVADNTNPRLESIERHTPATANTDSQTLIYKATFSEDVTGVTASDFALSSDSAGGENTTASTGQFTQTKFPNLGIPDLQTVSDTIEVSDSETATSVSVDVDITHDYIGDLKIDLIAPDGTSMTLHNNTGNDADDIDQMYTPNFGSIPIFGTWKLQIHDNYGADPGVLNSWTLTINYGDTATTLSSVTDVSGSGDAYYVTVSAAQDGTYNLDLVSSGHGIKDAANNSLTNVFPTGADETYTVSTTVADNTNPRLESIERHTPATANTDSQTLIYKATFSEDVTGVTASDFALSSDSAGGENTTASTGQFTQTKFPNLGIPDLQTVSDTIEVSDSETATSVSVDVDITHDYIGDLKIDLIAPDGTSMTLHNNTGNDADDIDQMYTPNFGSIPIFGTWKLQIHDNYGADPGVLNSWTLTINYGDTATTLSSVTDVSGSGDAYYVTVSAAQDGTYNLDLVSSGHGIKDAANNSLTNVFPTGADETYTVSTTVADNTNPRLESIERHTPATANTDSQTLIYKATFSEDVTGVTASDFALSSDSAGGENTTASTGQFTQTKFPNLGIPDLQTVSDTIEVSDSETATSVSVDVDITHDYIGDLKIDLIAPDGTSMTLHNNTGNDADDIDQMYTPNFGSIPIFGTWKLQIHDNYGADPGVLNSWTLTINYGDTATTLSSVTDVSGSGDAYYVTVSAAQDGTYNLDLVSSGHGIKDAAENPLTDTAPTTGTDHTYTVSTTVADSTVLTLTSIERSNPTTQNTNSQTLVYRVAFSESVTGVDTDDFVLSSDSTGRGNNNNNNAVSSELFTQTRLPLSPITNNNDISDTIKVPNSGTVTSVSVTVNISHTYIGDLKVELVAPDGTVKTLHNREGDGTNDIIKTYTPNFDDDDDAQIQGDWKLRINDNADGDTGTLNSWTLEVNYDTVADTTVSSCY